MMAGGVDGGAGDFWLPSDFPGEVLFHKVAEPRDIWTDRRFPADPRGLFHSNLRYQPEAPPPEEVESDEEEHLAGLTRRMAHAFLLDDEDPLSQLYPKVKAMAGSPQSTLCDHRIWNGSRNGSPNGASQVCSPPATPLEQQEDAWDLLTAAAGQVVRLRLVEEARRQLLHGRGLAAPPAKLAGVPVPAPHRSSRGTGVYCSPHLTPQQLQIERFYQLKQQQLMKQQASAGRPPQSRDGAAAGGGGYVEVLGGRHGGLPSPAWAARQHPPPPPPPQHHQVMHAAAAAAALIGGPGGRKESTGTGVFLPRRPGHPSEHRKKPASPAVLPERKIYYRNPNADEMTGYILDPDVLVVRGSRHLAHQQEQKRRQQYLRPQAAPVPDHYDNQHRLPAEWTY